MSLFMAAGGKYAFAENNEEVAAKPEAAPAVRVETPVEAPTKSTPSKFGKFAASIMSRTKVDVSTKADEAKPKINEERASSEIQDRMSSAESTKAASRAGDSDHVSEAKQVQKAPETKKSRLSQFLGVSNSDTSSSPSKQVIGKAAEKPVEVMAAPTPVKTVEPPAPSVTNVAPASRLNMFLQAVESGAPAKLPVANKETKPRQSLAPVSEKPAESVQTLRQGFEKATPRRESKVEGNSKFFDKQDAQSSTASFKQESKNLEPAAPHQETTSSDTLSKFKERLANVKTASNTENESDAKLQETKDELAQMKKRCAELEQENVTLRARLEIADAGKEALAGEVQRLSNEVSNLIASSKKSIPSSASFKLSEEKSENLMQNSLDRAKKLLAQGKISKAQYESAVRACMEATRTVSRA